MLDSLQNDHNKNRASKIPPTQEHLDMKYQMSAK